MSDIDAALIAAIEASAVTTPKPKRHGVQLIAVRLDGDDEPVRAASDKPLVKAFDYINTVAAA
jgi:hypothetical protein